MTNEKRKELKEKTFKVTKKEVDYFVHCGNHTGKDNILFCDENSNEREVFLLLHGSKNGTVCFNGKLLTLEQVFHELKKENIFDILIASRIKYIQVLCCHGSYLPTYNSKKYDITIKSYFDNKEVLLGKKLSDNIFNFSFVA